MPTATLTRREIFSASHRLHSKHLSDAENAALFGKCGYANGHGHNYALEVSVRAPIDDNGLVMNLTDLERIIEEHVMRRVDHRHLNLDVAEFADLNPTVENIAVVIWRWLKASLGELLYEVKLYETEKNFAIYRGE